MDRPGGEKRAPSPDGPQHDAAESGAEALEAALLAQLPHPVPATAAKIQALVDPCVTIKLDGVRTLLSTTTEGTFATTKRGVRRLVGDRSASKTSVFDTEDIDGDFYIFDVLFAEGQDVRHLPLVARLRAAAGILPARARLKRYFHGAGAEPLSVLVARLARSRPRLIDGTAMETLEGFIFCNMSDPYHVPSLKFKFVVTCDLQVAVAEERRTSMCDKILQLDVFVQKEQRLTPYAGSRSAPSSVVLTPAQAAACGIDAPPQLADQCILELSLQAGAWAPVRRRWDRERPNTCTTVRENITLHRQGQCDPKPLLAALRSRGAPTQADIDRLRERIMHAAGTAAAVAGGSATEALFLPDGARLAEALAAHAQKQGEEPAGDLVVVTLPARYEEQAAACASAAPATSVTLDGVACAARARGWKCRQQPLLNGADFLHGVRLPASVDALLRNLRFLLLTPRAPRRPAAVPAT